MLGQGSRGPEALVGSEVKQRPSPRHPSALLGPSKMGGRCSSQQGPLPGSDLSPAALEALLLPLWTLSTRRATPPTHSPRWSPCKATAPSGHTREQRGPAPGPGSGHQTHLRRSGSCPAGSPCLLSTAGSARHTWRCCHRPRGTQGPPGSANRQPRPRGGRTHRHPSPVVAELEPQLPGRTWATDPTRLSQMGGGAGTPPSLPPRDRPGLSLLFQAQRAGRQLPLHPTRKEGLSGKRGPGTKGLA